MFRSMFFGISIAVGVLVLIAVVMWFANSRRGKT
jgi:hypothetical protein